MIGKITDDLNLDIQIAHCLNNMKISPFTLEGKPKDATLLINEITNFNPKKNGFGVYSKGTVLSNKEYGNCLTLLGKSGDKTIASRLLDSVAEKCYIDFKNNVDNLKKRISNFKKASPEINNVLNSYFDFKKSYYLCIPNFIKQCDENQSFRDRLVELLKEDRTDFICEKSFDVPNTFQKINIKYPCFDPENAD